MLLRSVMKHGGSHRQMLKMYNAFVRLLLPPAIYHKTCTATCKSKRRKDANRLSVIILFISRLSKYTPKKSTFTGWIAPYTKARLWRGPRLCSIQEWNGRLVFKLTSFRFLFQVASGTECSFVVFPLSQAPSNECYDHRNENYAWVMKLTGTEYRIRNITCSACVGIKKHHYFSSVMITLLRRTRISTGRYLSQTIKNLDWLI